MMSMILELVGGRKTLYGVLVGFIVGLLVGWWVLGIWLLPVEWKDAAPVDLHSDYQKIFVSAVADSYSLHGNADLARTVLSERWEKKDLAKIIGKLKAEAADDAQAQRLDALAQALDLSPVESAEPAAKPPAEKESLVSKLLPLCGVLAVVFIVVALAWSIMRLVRGRGEKGEAVPARETISPEMAEIMPTGTVLGHFITSYALGNDHYDDSFSVETDAGEFLGECGAGIGETIGVGTPDKVTAFEVWLFDKNDIRTETKVLMSTHAFNDESLRSKLAPKGEPVLAKVGQVVTLETASLQVTARVTEMEYGNEGMPEESFFTRVSIELVASMIKSDDVSQDPFAL